MPVDIIIPARLDNLVAVDMVVGHIKRTLKEKSRKHQEELQRLGKQVEDEPLSENVLLLEQTREIVAMSKLSFLTHQFHFHPVPGTGDLLHLVKHVS